MLKEQLKVGLFSDHAGFTLKNKIHDAFKGIYILHDFGCYSAESTDYPLFAQNAAESLKDGRIDRAVLVCGTGTGMAIAANRFSWIRAFVAHDESETLLARQHNDANVICFSGRNPANYILLFELFMSTPFEGGRHKRRIDLMSA